jgi:hypothetical protein
MIKHKHLDELRARIREKKNDIASKRENWIKANPYYYNQFVKSLKSIIDENSKVLHVHCGTGYVLNQLDPKIGVGIDDSPIQIQLAKEKYPHLKFYNQNIEEIYLDEIFDYVLITHIEDIVDIKAVMSEIRKCYDSHTRVIVVFYNYLWHPLIKFAEHIKLKHPQRLHNWVSPGDLNNILELCNLEVIINKKIILCPYKIPMLSYVVNRFIARLPFFRLFTFLRIFVARPILQSNKEYSVSIIVPCKNEEGNIEDAVKRIPMLGKETEIIFCDDKSTDGTVEKVRGMIDKYKDKNIKLVHGPGICKAENVWVGFDTAQGEILMILDADLTVMPEELPYFYEAISKGYGEFINGSRLVYPMQDDAMRGFNVIGNKFFSLLFSYILDINIKDTLCGTKVLMKKDYNRIKKLRGNWGIQDRWGDYELIFGASKCHLKIIDLPVHYTERVYGESKMKKRLKNGCNMLKISLVALLKIKFY